MPFSEQEAGEKLKSFLLGTTNTPTPLDPGNFSMSTTSEPTVWTTLPPPSQQPQLDKDPSELATISEAYGQSSSTASLTSSVSSQYQYNSYPTSAQYAMYTSANPATYYQQMASNLRAQTTFPYTLAAPTYAYTGNYPVDYTATAAAYQNPYYNNIRGGAYPYSLNTAAAYASVANSLASDTVLGGTSSADVSSIGSATSSNFPLKEKKVKPKKKKTGSCSPGDETYARVFIWDLEDVALISRNFLASLTHSQSYPLGYAAAANNISHLMDGIAMSTFSDINEVLEGDVTNIEDAVVDETVMDGGPMDNLRGLDVMRRVAPKYAAFRQLYTEISTKTMSVDGFKQEQTVWNYDLLERVGMVTRAAELSQSAHHLQTIPNFGQRWQCAQRCMELVVKRSAESSDKYANVVLSNDGVVFGAAQLMIAGLSGAVPIENVYSVTKQGKESIFEKIQTRYGKKCSFVCVTSSDTAATAKRLSIPVWPLQSNNDLDKLLAAQTNYLLG
uniref:Eyes absent homolog n=1 Tax=Caenorhabditis japonica TaxID=281687 RepID=A0A8R1HM28_CAEJA